MSELLLCVSQEEAKQPYKFKVSNKSVYSFEEAVYHCYFYWKQSVDDFASDKFITWVKEELGLSYLSSKIREISKIQNYSDKLIGFLSLIDYFDQTQLVRLKTQLIEWEKRLEWERLKERGDYLMQNNDPSKACVLYKHALTFTENAELLNNLAVAQMRMEMYAEAVANLEKSMALSKPGLQQYLNLAEAAIYNGEFEKAVKALKQAEALDINHPDIPYLYGELNIKTENIRFSVEYFKKALSIHYDEYYVYRLADVYVQLRKYEKALETLNSVKLKSKKFLLRQADIYAKADNIPAAIKAIEKALLTDSDNVELWVKLAMYHRMDYNLEQAYAAITKALTLSADNDLAQLEEARIKKAQGKTKDYQVVLHNILSGFKKKYRDLLNI